MSAPALTVNTDGNPYVEVFFDPADFPAEVTRLTIWRYSEGREWRVRGGVNVAPGTAALDFEAPFNVPAAYRAEMFDSSGASLGWTEVGEATVPYEGMVVHQPLDPALWVDVLNLDDSAPSRNRPSPGDVLHPEGEVVGTWVGARRRGVEGVRVSFLTRSVADADQVQAMLGTYTAHQVPVLCIRDSGRTRWPRTFFAAGAWVELDSGYRYGATRIAFEAACTEVAPPFPGLAVPLLSYDDLDIAYPSLDARDAAYSSYTEMDRDYSLAGMSG